MYSNQNMIVLLLNYKKKSNSIKNYLKSLKNQLNLLWKSFIIKSSSLSKLEQIDIDFKTPHGRFTLNVGA